MGKYMRKAKITGDVAVMEILSQSPSQSPLGVRTRAKTHALLQSLQSPPPNPEPSSYLQLRSRRLEKISPPLNDTRKQQPAARRDGCGLSPNPESSANPSSRGTTDLGTRACKEIEAEDQFGENNLDFEGRERSTRETTPCSLIRESDTAETPGSTTRRTASTAANQRIQNVVQRNVPTTQEIEEFFACAEQQQQRLFTEKYNFDIVNDMPLPGRYEWVRVNH